MQLLNPRVDVVFKMLFTREPRLLQSMLEAVLDVPIRSLEILNPEIPRDLSGDKNIVLDVRVLLDIGTRVDVEMQVRVTPELRPRMVYYAARDFVQQLSRGGGYETLTPTILVVWLDQPLTAERQQFHRIFELRDNQSGDLFSEHLAIHVLEMREWNGASPGLLRQWARFLTIQNNDQLATLAAETPIMEQASRSLESLSEDPQAARLAQEREESAFFYRMGLAMSRTEGRQEGLEEGRQEGLEEGRREGLRQGVMQLCAAVGLDVTPERQTQLDQFSAAQLKTLIDHLVAHRTWPE